MKDRKRKYLARISYKRLIVLISLSLICIMLVLFSVYKYSEYKYQRNLNARKEASERILQIIKNFNDRTEALQNHYLIAIESESVNWLIENEMSYSDYSRYTRAFNVLNKNTTDVSGFALINYKTGWVLSNKGLFSVPEIVNADALEKYLSWENGEAPKNYWAYSDAADAVRQGDKNYRFSIDTEGLNLVIGLPFNSFNEYARLIVNVSPKKYDAWITPWLNECEDIVVLDDDGNAVYSSDSRMMDECVRMKEEGLQVSEPINKKDDAGSNTYVISSARSGFLGWTFFMVYDVNKGFLADSGLSGGWFLANILLMFLSFILAVLAVYYPVGALIRDMAGKEERYKIQGNEIYYLSDQFQHLRKDKTALEETVTQQQTHLEELFELRLIRGEISEAEWRDYTEEFCRTPQKYFVCAVLVLDSRGDAEEQSNLNEDAICLKILQNMPDKVRQIPWMPAVYHAGTICAVLAADSEEDLQNVIGSYYAAFSDYIGAAFGSPIRMGVSSVHSNYGHVHNSYRESVNALLTQNIAGVNETGLFYYISDLAVDKDYDGKKYDLTYEKAIQRSIRSMDEQESQRITEEFFEYLGNSAGSVEEIRACILSYVNAILLVAFQMRVDIEKINPNGIGRIYQDILDGMELSGISGYVRHTLIDAIFVERLSLINEKSGSIAESVYRLIDQHKGNLTLYECADLLGVDSAYVWKALKLVSNKSYSDIAEEYKLDEAKRMLLQTDMKVNEIAAALNYSNTQNFIRFFSKCTGLTPGKFRRLH